MNKNLQATIVTASVIIGIMLIYPPYLHLLHKNGYAFLFAFEDGWRIDVSKIIIQIMAVGVLAVAGYFILSLSKESPANWQVVKDFKTHPIQCVAWFIIYSIHASLVAMFAETETFFTAYFFLIGPYIIYGGITFAAIYCVTDTSAWPWYKLLNRVFAIAFFLAIIVQVFGSIAMEEAMRLNNQ